MSKKNQNKKKSNADPSCQQVTNEQNLITIVIRTRQILLDQLNSHIRVRIYKEFPIVNLFVFGWRILTEESNL